MTKIYISRAAVETFAIIVCAAIVFWQVTLNKNILGAQIPTILLSATFSVASFWVAWIIRGAHKSNLDTAIHEMGNMEREVFIALLTEYTQPNEQFHVQELIDARSKGK